MSVEGLTEILKTMGFDVMPCFTYNCEGWYMFNVHNPAYRRGFFCTCDRFFCKDCAVTEFGSWYQHKYCLKCRCVGKIDAIEGPPPKPRKFSTLRKSNKKQKIPKLERSLSLRLPQNKKKVVTTLRNTHR